MSADPLGDRVKALESVATTQQLSSFGFVIARVDGRAFHTFTQGMLKPADPWIFDAMTAATIAVTADLQPKLAYVQSDEATFAWNAKDLPFNGRTQKLCSLVAAGFSAGFIDSLVRKDVERYLKLHKPPMFDCRIWSVPAVEDVCDAFVWRERDAVKNSISAAASTLASEKVLHGLNQRQREELLVKHGFDWSTTPRGFKAGSYVRRQSRMMELDAETLAKIPEAKRPPPEALFERHVVTVDPELKDIAKLFNT